MDINQALSPVRPITVAVGTILIIVGVLKFFGVQIPINGSGIDLAAIGFLMKAI